MGSDFEFQCNCNARGNQDHEMGSVGCAYHGGERQPRAHTFATTAEAYNASQTHDEIHDGDVLVATEEGVVGIMVSAWPTAVTDVTGAFHDLDDKFTWEAIPRLDGEGTDDYSTSLRLAAEKVEWLERRKAGELVAGILAPLPEGTEFTLGWEAGRAYRATYRKNAAGLWDQVAGTCEAPHVVNMEAEHLGFVVGVGPVRKALEAGTAFDPNVEALAERAVRAIIEVTDDRHAYSVNARRAAIKRAAERFGFVVTEPTTDLDAAAAELGVEL